MMLIYLFVVSIHLFCEGNILDHNNDHNNEVMELIKHIMEEVNEIDTRFQKKDVELNRKVWFIVLRDMAGGGG